MTEEPIGEAKENIAEEKETKLEDIKFPWKYIGLAFVVIVALWFASPIVLGWIFNNNWDNVDKFGGGYGAVGALFSGFALAGVIVAIMLQRRELELQREELRQTREELARSAQAQEASEKALVNQAASLEATARLTALAYLPLLNLDIILSGRRQTILKIMNQSTIPAFDVVVMLSGSYDSENIPLGKFVKDFGVSNPIRRLHLESRLIWLSHLTPDENGRYAIFDRMSHRFLPGSKQIVAELSFPLRSEYVYAFLQYRDVQGSNYYQLFEFGLCYGDGEEDDFYESSVQPPVVTPASRIHIQHSGSDEIRLESEGGKPIPDSLAHFAERITDAIPPGLYTEDRAIFEERGKIEPIN